MFAMGIVRSVASGLSDIGIQICADSVVVTAVELVIGMRKSSMTPTMVIGLSSTRRICPSRGVPLPKVRSQSARDTTATGAAAV